MAKAKKNKSRAGASPAPVEVKNGPQDRTLPARKLKPKVYRRELSRLQVELMKLQEYVRAKGLKVAVLFEGRDAAGKGGVIKRITQRLNPRTCRIVALGTPTEREGSRSATRSRSFASRSGSMIQQSDGS